MKKTIYTLIVLIFLSIILLSGCAYNKKSLLEYDYPYLPTEEYYLPYPYTYYSPYLYSPYVYPSYPYYYPPSYFFPPYMYLYP